MEVTEALEMIPLSIRFKLVNKPPMVQSLQSIFRLNFFSLSDVLGRSSIDRLLGATSLRSVNLADILMEHAMSRCQ